MEKINLMIHAHGVWTPFTDGVEEEYWTHSELDIFEILMPGGIGKSPYNTTVYPVLEEFIKEEDFKDYTPPEEWDNKFSNETTKALNGLTLFRDTLKGDITLYSYREDEEWELPIGIYLLNETNIDRLTGPKDFYNTYEEILKTEDIIKYRHKIIENDYITVINHNIEDEESLIDILNKIYKNKYLEKGLETGFSVSLWMCLSQE